MYLKETLELNNKKILKIETNKIAKKATSSILADIDGTTVLIAVVYSNNSEFDFLPLKVDYFERYYASGKIPYNYFKREGKPSEREILIGRLVDRSIRPMFPKNFFNEIQITITVISVNPEINPDIIAINGTSIALAISGIPFDPIAAIKITSDENKIIINPLQSEILNTNLIVVGKKNLISMLEGSFNEIKEKDLLNLINSAINEFDKIISFTEKIKKTINSTPIKYYEKINLDKHDSSKKKYYSELESIYKNHKYNIEEIKIFKDNLTNNFLKETNENENNITLLTNNFEKDIIRKKILTEKIRLDYRKLDEIRDINIEVNFLERVHGSVLFSRGDTQALVNITLGTYKDIQLVDCVFLSHYKNNFILHYNFPPYAVNEIGNVNLTKRREIGHGNLSRMALLPIIPSYEDYPYVIRIVSEITSSDGSSSMATVCGSSLALINAGIPIKNNVAGISIGLIKEEKEFIILTDISSYEDNIGDMDFKITGTKNGITAIQMDLKINGIDGNILEKILENGFISIIKILKIMENNIKNIRISNIANIPKIKFLKINKEKIKNLIGKNGNIIKNLTDKHKCEINVTDEGIVNISSLYEQNIENAISEIKSLTQEIKIGMTFEGKVIKLAEFGAFVNLFHKTDGLLHISKYRNNLNLKEGYVLNVIVSKIDKEGKISLDLTGPLA